MILAAYRDDAYNVVLLIHIVAALVAFAPAFVNPLLAKYFQREADAATMQVWSRFAAGYTHRIAMAGLVVLLLTGIGMITMSGDVLEFSQAWVSAAFVVWFLIAGVVSGMLGKGERLLGEGDASGQRLIDIGGPVASLLLLVMLYLMIFKPGL